MLPALAAAFLGYFGFHALNGTYGLTALAEFEAETEVLEAELAELQAERTALDARAAMLRQNLDPDLLDELARRSLNVIAPNEFVLIP